MTQRLEFFQIGIGNGSELADLVYGRDVEQVRGLPCLENVDWSGTLMDVSIESVKESLLAYKGYPGIQIFNGCLSASPGFNSVGIGYLNSSIGFDEQIMLWDSDNDYPFNVNYLMNVYSISLEMLLSTAEYPVGVVMMDIQGSEGDVLDSYDWDGVRPYVMIIECHSLQNKRRVFHALENNGYKYIREQDSRPNYVFVREDLS